jgi:hypothetical protein
VWCGGGGAPAPALGLSVEELVGTDEQRVRQLQLAVRIGDRFARAVLAAAIPA